MAATGFRSPAAQTAYVIVVAVIARLIASHFVGLGTDESYSVAVARDLQLSYFDHPPMQYWLVHAAAPLVGYGRGSRWPFIGLFAASSWLMFVLTRRLFGERAGLWAVLALTLSAFFTLPAASWVLPDGPLLLALLGGGGQPGRGSGLPRARPKWSGPGATGPCWPACGSKAWLGCRNTRRR